MTTALATKPKRKKAAASKAELNGWAAPSALSQSDRNDLCVTIPKSATTLAGFRQWCDSDDFPHEGRIAFLGGELFIDMTWERLASHVLVKSAVYNALGPRVDRKDMGKFFPDGAGLVNVAANVANAPDGMFASWSSFAEGRVRKVPSNRKPDDYAELEGTPDWVMEIFSDSSVTKDTKQLLKFYYLAGNPEYWLIDARGDELHFQILRHEPEGYVAQPSKSGWQFSPVFGAAFRLTRTKDRLGDWAYRLETKESKKR